MKFILICLLFGFFAYSAYSLEKPAPSEKSADSPQASPQGAREIPSSSAAALGAEASSDSAKSGSGESAAEDSPKKNQPPGKIHSHRKGIGKEIGKEMGKKAGKKGSKRAKKKSKKKRKKKGKKNSRRRSAGLKSSEQSLEKKKRGAKRSVAQTEEGSIECLEHFETKYKGGYVEFKIVPCADSSHFCMSYTEIVRNYCRDDQLIRYHCDLERKEGYFSESIPCGNGCAAGGASCRRP